MISVHATEEPQVIIPPGIVNLIGDRYTLLRCPEIEQHMHRSRAHESHTMGLAKFKLGVMGYDDTRFDFSSLPPKAFHPIGKLTCMTFKFERPDGGVYNFRGANHTITLAIRYYEPETPDTFQDYSLNPDYNPDFFKLIQEDSETDSEDDSTE